MIRQQRTGAATLILATGLLCAAALPGCAHQTPMPTFLSNVSTSDVQEVSIDGWGPGAAGNSIRFVDNPFGATEGEDALKAIRQGQVVHSNAMSVSDASQGGAAWLVLHLKDGKMIQVDRAVVTTGNVSTGSKETFVITEGKDRVVVQDTTGRLNQSLMTLFKETSTARATRPAAWNHWTAHDIRQIAIDGNTGDTWFHHPLSGTGSGESQGTTDSDTAAAILRAVQTDPVVPQTIVNMAPVYGWQATGRTNSRRLALHLSDGSTIDIIAGFKLKPAPKQSGSTANGTSQGGSNANGTSNNPVVTPAIVPNPAPVFAVIYATKTGLTTVYLQDTSGKLAQGYKEMVSLE